LLWLAITRISAALLAGELVLICLLMTVTTARTGIIAARLSGLLSNLPGSGAGRRRAACSGFTEVTTGWRFPDDMLSFYLGTGRPPQYQMQIAERLILLIRLG
jgi:hypothetical protein